MCKCDAVTRHVSGRFESARQIVRDSGHRLPTFSIALNCKLHLHIFFFFCPLATADGSGNVLLTHCQSSSVSASIQVRTKERKVHVRSVLSRGRPVQSISLMHLGIQVSCGFLASFSAGPIYFDNVIIVNLFSPFRHRFLFYQQTRICLKKKKKTHIFIVTSCCCCNLFSLPLIYFMMKQDKEEEKKWGRI